MEFCRLLERGEDITLTRLIDDRRFQLETAALRRELGDGFIRDAKGVAQARHSFSIPMEEAAMLAAAEDADWLEFWYTDSTPALARLAARFPHWVVAEGGGLL